MHSKLLRYIINGLFPPLCTTCGREGAWLCPIHQAHLHRLNTYDQPIIVPGVDGCILRGSYDDQVLQSIITNLKFHAWTALEEILADLLRPCIDQLRHEIPATIVPIPLHPRRQRERGFNQAEIIARVIGQELGQSVRPALFRIRPTAQQARLHESERHRNVHGAFARRAGVEIQTSCAILVDDVLTTGSTIAECASVLRAGGVTRVIACALAKG